MKKGLFIPIALVSLMTLVGCQKTSPKPSESTDPETSETNTEESTGGESTEPVTYAVTITNKDALQAAWQVGEADRSLALTIAPEGNITALINSGEITFASSNEAVATVMGKNVHAVSAGEAKITVTYHDASDSVDLTIAAKPTNKDKFGTVHEGTAEDPFDNEDAIKVGKFLKEAGDFGSDEYYVTGKIASFYHAPGARTDGAVSWFLEPATAGGEKFEIYKCYKDSQGKVFLTDDDVWVGGTAVAYGKFAEYNGQYETAQAVFVSCEGDKPQPRQTIDATFAEMLAAGAALDDGADSYDYYKFDAYVTVKDGSNYFLTATKGEELVSAKYSTSSGEKDYYSNAFEIYGAKGDDLLAKLTKDAEVTVTAVLKNYHGQVENLLALTADDVVVKTEGGSWEVAPEPAAVEATMDEVWANEAGNGKVKFVVKDVDFFAYATNKGVATETAGKYGNALLGPNGEYFAYGLTATATALAWDGTSLKYIFTNPQDFTSNDVTKVIKPGDKVDLELIRADYNTTKEVVGVITKVTEGEGGGGGQEEIPEPAAVEATMDEVWANEAGNGKVKFVVKDVDFFAYATNKGVATETAGKYGNALLGPNGEYFAYGLTATATALAWDGTSLKYIFTNPQDFTSNDVTKVIKPGDKVDLELIRADYNTTKEVVGVITKVTPKPSAQPIPVLTGEGKTRVVGADVFVYVDNTQLKLTEQMLAAATIEVKDFAVAMSSTTPEAQRDAAQHYITGGDAAVVLTGQPLQLAYVNDSEILLYVHMDKGLDASWNMHISFTLRATLGETVLESELSFIGANVGEDEAPVASGAFVIAFYAKFVSEERITAMSTAIEAYFKTNRPDTKVVFVSLGASSNVAAFAGLVSDYNTANNDDIKAFLGANGDSSNALSNAGYQKYSEQNYTFGTSSGNENNRKLWCAKTAVEDADVVALFNYLEANWKPAA